MLLKYDHTMRPERFHISDLSTPVYLQADGKRFLEFSYNGNCPFMLFKDNQSSWLLCCSDQEWKPLESTGSLQYD